MRQFSIGAKTTARMCDMSVGDFAITDDGTDRLLYKTRAGTVEILNSEDGNRYTTPGDTPVEILSKGEEIIIKL